MINKGRIIIVLLISSVILYGCAATPEPGFGSWFAHYENYRVKLSSEEVSFPIMITLDENGPWRICGSGSNFVRICRVDGSSSRVYPTESVFLVEPKP